MPARVVGRIELEGVRVFMNATSSAEKAFTLLGGAALTAAATVTVAMAGLTSAVAALGTTAVKSAASFEQEMKGVQAVSGDTDAETAALSKEILKLSQNYDLSANEIAQAAREIEKSGVELGTYREQIIKAALNLSILTRGELSTAKAATFLGGTMTAWGIQGNEVNRITNALTIAANASAISVNDLIRSFQQATSIADFLGFSFEDITAALALMGQEYMRNSDAGTSLKQMMLRLMGPSGKAADLLNEYGINLHNASGETYPFIEIVKQLDKAFGDEAVALGRITEAERNKALATIFGSDAGRSAALIAMKGIKSYEDAQKAIEGNATSAQKMADTIQSALLPRLTMFKNILASFAISAGTPAVKAISDAVYNLNEQLKVIDLTKFEVLGQFITDIVTKGAGSGDALRQAFGPDVASLIEGLANIFLKLRDSIQQYLIPALFSIKIALLGEKSTTMAAGEAFNELGNILGNLVKSTSGVLVFMATMIAQLPTVVSYVDNLTTAVRNFGKAVSETPQFARFLDIAPILAILAIVPTLMAAFVAVKTAAVAMFAAIVGGSGGTILIIAAIVAALAALYIWWPEISKAVTDFANTVYNAIAQLVMPTLNAIGAWFANLWTFVGPVITTIANVLGIVLVAALTLVILAIGAVVKAFEILGDFVLKVIGTIVVMAAAQWGIIIRIVSNLVVGTIQIISDFFNSIKETWVSIWSFLANITGDALNWVIKRFLVFLQAVEESSVIFSGITKTIKKVVEGITTTFEVVSTEIPEVTKDATEKVSAFWEETGKRVTNAISGAKDYVIGASNDMANAGVEAANRYGSAWEGALAKANMAQSAAATGQDIPQLPTPVTPRGGGGTGPPGQYAGTGGGEDADKWTKFFKEALRALPLMNSELADFLGKLAKEAPERAQPMVDALMTQVDLIKQMAIEKSKLIAIDIEIFRIDRNIAGAQLELNKINLQMKAIELKYAGQILAYQNQLLNVQWQMTQIQNEINRLQQENVTLARQRIELETSIFQQEQAIASIDREIQKLNRVDRQLELEKAKAYQDILPALQEQERLERQISKVHNKRLELLSNEQKLRIDIQKIQIDEQLRGVSRDLEQAWTNMDVQGILGLDAQKLGLEKEQSALQDRLDSIQSEMDLREAYENLTINLLEQEKLAVDETIEAYNDRMLLIEQAEERDKAARAVKIAQLELEKQKIEDTIQPIRDKIFEIGQEIAWEQQRNALRIFDLQQEYYQLSLVAQQLQFNIQTLQLQMANEQLQMAQRAIQLEQYINEEEQKKAALEETRLKQEQVYAELIAKFLDSMKQSGAFSAAEAIEVAKRLQLWDDSVGKLFEMYQQYQNLIQATNDLGKAVNDLPSSKTIDIYINVHGSVPALASGGPALAGMPHIVGEQGRELFIPDRSGIVLPHAVTQTLLARSQPLARTTNTTDNRSYTVNASYANTQSPASVAMDMRAMEMMAKR